MRQASALLADCPIFPVDEQSEALAPSINDMASAYSSEDTVSIAAVLHVQDMVYAIQASAGTYQAVTAITAGAVALASGFSEADLQFVAGAASFVDSSAFEWHYGEVHQSIVSSGGGGNPPGEEVYRDQVLSVGMSSRRIAPWVIGGVLSDVLGMVAGAWAGVRSGTKSKALLLADCLIGGAIGSAAYAVGLRFPVK